MENEIRNFWVVNCYSVQINATVKVTGYREIGCIRYPASWPEQRRLRAIVFSNYKNVSKIKLAAVDYYFETEELARKFIKEFYINAQYLMKKNMNKGAKSMQVRSALKDIQDRSKKEIVFTEFNPNHFEWIAEQERLKDFHNPKKKQENNEKDNASTFEKEE